ncbi:MAG: DUF5050 domain-containing protein [Butyrivibrio sp.]|nr:DUF5050 domain-containing protein [Butyrivibrio sp.]
MSKKSILFMSLFALLITGFVILYVLDQRVPMDPADIGNTAGNLQNSGLFFEMGDKIYFSNASDSGCLYSMNPDESNPKRLTSMGVKYINGANDFLYFYMDSTKIAKNVKGLGSASNQYGIYRCRISGRDQTCLLRDFCGEVQLCGEYLYYQVKTNGGSLNKIRVDQKNQSLVKDEYISPVCYDNGVIYFSGVTDDHNIHAMHTTAGDTESSIINGFYFFPVVTDGFIYYLNGDSNYSLWRTNLYSGAQELITSDRVDCFTMDHEHIYYSFSDKDAPSLRRIDLDGNNKMILYDGVVNSINVTSRYVYFKEFGNDDVLYHIPIDLSQPATVFAPVAK